MKPLLQILRTRDYLIKLDTSTMALHDRSSCWTWVTRVGMHSIATLLCGKVKTGYHWEGEIGMGEVGKEDLSVRGLPRGFSGRMWRGSGS